MTKTKRIHRAFIVAALVAVLVMAMLVMLPPRATQANNSNTVFDRYHRAVPNVDLNLTAAVTRQATALQTQALNQFRNSYGNQAMIRWDNFAGSPDVMMGFHTAPSSGTPETVARAFVQENAALFGVEAASLVLSDQKEGMGGYMLRFQQKAGNLEVAGGGVGFLMNREKQIRMVMGSTFRDVDVQAAPVLNAEAAATRAQTEIAQYARTIPGGLDHLLTPGLDAIAAEVAPVLRAPRLNVFPTANGYKLSWDVITFSRNPFGVFLTQVDAHTGEILRREDMMRYQQQNPLPYTADIYPSTPGIANYDTGALKLINGMPEGLTRVQLRGFNPGMNATAVEGTLSGTHAFVRNTLATKQPFAQAAQGTFHFRQNNAPLEAQPNEADDLAEPSEHFDGVNMFFFINYLLEYIDDIHVRDDRVHSPIGTGDFPDNYVNSDRPLVGLVHIPNIGATAPIYEDAINNGDALQVVLGYDNAGSLPLTQTVDTPAGPQKVVVNPTIYGHGYLLNDPAKDGPVAYHEGMHSISTPIAGLEGGPEGAAMNEGQADLWAYAITGDDSIGAHTIQGARYRQLFRSRGINPDTIAYIRSARSSLKYSKLGTYGNPAAFEEHKDGEIYAAAMFDLLELMKTAEPQEQFFRPAFGDGQPTKRITKGQETWERIFLGSLYLLGLTAPDTFVKARDAMIMADRILYSTDPSDLDAPGQHEALIWQVYAAREIGLHAAAPQGGVVTISTAVPQIALDQNHTSAPQGVKLEPASAKSVRVSWQPVNGAYAYEVFKRRKGSAGQRQYQGVSGRPYFDGDQTKTGWTHVAFVKGGNTSSYVDEGAIQEIFRAAGIKSSDDANGFNEMFDSEYAVRAISLNPNRQSGFSDLSGSASFTSSVKDISSAIQAAVSNVSFANGIFEFDQTLKNNGVTGVDATAYGPVSFKIVGISNPAVTVANADNGGNGRSAPGVFNYNQTLLSGATSAPKRLRFNDPQAQLFTFDAVVTGRVRGNSIPANGSQPYDGDGGGQQEHVITSQTDTYNGTVILGSLEIRGAVNGVDYVDVPFTAKPGSFGVTGRLTTTTPADLDFEILDSNGNVLDSSGNFIDAEEVSAVIIPGRTYIYRVIGYGNGPTQFTITSTQFFSDSITGGGSGSSFGQQTQGVTNIHLVRFTVNPLTRAITISLL
ncbi:MAG: M36 family metallopeptidase [Pyrinomonadaceae bacterium]|nr:M36 family metallopeptidase [Pyrinomonadaceae bacterium]